MPVVPLSEKSGNAPFIGETEFVDPENEAEQVKLYIYLAQAEFVDAALQVSSHPIILSQTSSLLL